MYYYLDIIAKQILEDSAIQYKKKIKKIIETNDQDNLEEDIYIRSNVFKKKIPQIYNYTCSISGLTIKSNHGHSIIDACHIIPFSIEHDDTIGNGIALCPNLHRALDSGLITEVLDWHNNNVNLYANCQKISIFLSVF